MPDQYGQLDYADESNLEAIADAVHDIAKNQTAIPWKADSQFVWPEVKDVIREGGFPLLVTDWPELFGYVDDEDRIYPGKEMYRQMGLRQMAWDIQLWGVWPYQAGNQMTGRVPIRGLKLIERAFAQYDRLNGTCAMATIVAPKISKVRYPAGDWYMEVSMRIRAYEDVATGINN